ncbi:MAG: hypothetical protein J7K21_01550 [Desulfurococcales archaeon]|nr:hypothetical protein [Desulfurococcales archaeon]
MIGNKRYADGTVLMIREIMESVKRLGVSLNKVKLRDWWLLQSRGSPRPEDRGNRDIRLISRGKARVMLYNSSFWDRYDIDVRVPRIYSEIFERIAELGMKCKLGYLARMVVLDSSYVRVYAELQISIPYELYLSHRRRFERPLGNNVAGIDVNVDRINLAIINKRGILRDTKTFHYPSLASTTLKGEQRRSLLHKVVHDVLKYAYYHGVSTIVLEDPEILGYLKSRWIRSNERRNSRYNRRVSIFRSSIIEEFVLHAPEYGLNSYYVDPAYTSKLAELIAKDMGLDRYTASAYIIALEYLELRPKQVIKSIQK